MKTVVIQSFRTSNVPSYVVECCRSVETWAQQAGYAYQFFDDSFLELAPAWYREKAGSQICLVTDLARLVMAQRLLMDGFDRVVWCDADMLIFRPELLVLDQGWTGTYCREVWLAKDDSGRPVAYRKMNNSLCVFAKAGLDHLATYIGQCCQVLQQPSDTINEHSVGTELLTPMYLDRALITTVGIVGFPLMEAILHDDEATMAFYLEQQGSPVYAVNLCNAIRRAFGNSPKLYDYLCAGVIERLRFGSAGEFLSRG